MNPQHQEFKFPSIKPHPWVKVFQKFKADPQLIELISKILVYSPKERMKPIECLLHPYFAELRSEQFSIPNAQLPDFFNFTKEELSIQPQLNSKLVPSWLEKKKNWIYQIH